MQRRRILSVVSAAGLLLGFAQTGAHAESGGERVTVVDAAAGAAARQDAARDRVSGRERAALVEARADLTRRAAKVGVTYLDADVEAFEPTPGVIVALPKAVSVNALKLHETEDTSTAEVTVSAGQEAVAGRQGVGMGWSTGTSGCYTITLSGKGTMQSCWYKKQLLSDGDATYNYWAYQRKAWGQPYEISGLNWSVTGMNIRSYPQSASASMFKAIMDRKPGSDFNGNCDDIPIQIGISVKGVSLGFSFKDCDTYDITFGSNYGDMTNYYKQGALFNGGNREVAYQIGVKTSSGTPYWTDYQRLEMARYVYPATTCAANGSKTC